MIGLFVDVPNIFYNCKKKFNGRMNYQRLWEEIVKQGQITRAFAYGFQIEREASPFIHCLRKIGFECKWKTLIKYKKDDQEKFRHIHFAVDIAMDVVRNIERFDTLVLVSSDPSLAELVQWSLERGIKTTVIGARLPSQLKEIASQWTEITESFIDPIGVTDGAQPQ